MYEFLHQKRRDYIVLLASKYFPKLYKYAINYSKVLFIKSGASEFKKVCLRFYVPKHDKQLSEELQINKKCHVLNILLIQSNLIITKFKDCF